MLVLNRGSVARSSLLGVVNQATLLSLCVWVTVSQAQTAWVPAGSGDWFEAANWTGGVPSALLDATIDNLGESVVAQANASAQRLTVGDAVKGSLQVSKDGSLDIAKIAFVGRDDGSMGKVSVSGGKMSSGFSVAGISSKMVVGYAGNGELSVADGGAVEIAGTALFGYDSAAKGTLTVTGKGSSYYSDGATVVGFRGAGDLKVLKGGMLQTRGSSTGDRTDSTGKGLVSGAGSTWTDIGTMYIGNHGKGEISVLDGGVIQSSYVLVGSQSDGIGKVIVSGPGAGWKSQFVMSVGESGRGELTVSSGGQLASSQSLFIGRFKGAMGVVDVTGEGSQVSAQWDVNVGVAGDGKLLIEDGGQFRCGSISIGQSVGSVGLVSVKGLGSRLSSNSFLSISPYGELKIVDGGYLSIKSNAVLNGRMEIAGDGSRWDGGSPILVGSSGSLIIRDGGTVSMSVGRFANLGSVDVEAGGLLKADSLFSYGAMSNDGEIIGNVQVLSGGVLTGKGSFAGSVTIADGGVFSPGSSPGNVSTPTTTWGDKGVYRWEINAVDGFGGSEGSAIGWDYWTISDLLIVGQFKIALTSLTSDDLPGLLVNWNPHTNKSWRIATALNGGFHSLENLSIDTQSFQNPLKGGRFGLSSSADGQDLYVQFTAVPELSTFWMVGVFALVAGLGIERSRSPVA